MGSQKIGQEEWLEAIQVLEGQLTRAETPEEISSICRRLLHLYRQDGPAKNDSKASKYAYLAADAYVAMGRMAPAVALLNVLKTFAEAENLTKRLHRRISETFSLPVQKAHKKDDHLPPPTPFQEMKGFVTFDNDDQDLIRYQWSENTNQKTPLFSWLRSSEVFDLIHLAFNRELAPGAVLFREGDRAEAFYIVADGEMELTTSAGFTRRFSEGECFGEIALLGKMRRTASMKAVTGTKLLEFSEEALKQCFEINSQLEAKIMHFYELRLFLNSASRHSIFEGIGMPMLESIWDQLTALRIPAGRVLFEDSMAHSDRFYLVTKGRCEGFSGDQKLATWGPGQFIGPSKSLSQIIAAEECHLLECHELVFQQYFEAFPKLKKAFEERSSYDFFEDEITNKVLID